MKFNKRYILLFTLLYALMLLYPIVYASNTYQPVNLSIDVNSDKPDYFRWEPIDITYAITNNHGISGDFGEPDGKSIVINLPKNFVFKSVSLIGLDGQRTPIYKNTSSNLEIYLPKSSTMGPITTYANLMLVYNKSSDRGNFDFMHNDVVKLSWLPLSGYYHKVKKEYFINVINDPPRLYKCEKKDAENDGAFSIEYLDNDSMALRCILLDVDKAELTKYNLTNSNLGTKISSTLNYTGRDKPYYARLSDGWNESEKVIIYVGPAISDELIRYWYIPTFMVLFSIILTPEISSLVFLYNRCLRKTRMNLSKSNWFFISDLWMLAIMVIFCCYGLNLSLDTSMSTILMVITAFLSSISLSVIKKNHKLLPLIIVFVILLILTLLLKFTLILLILSSVPTVIYILYRCLNTDSEPPVNDPH